MHGLLIVFTINLVSRNDKFSYLTMIRLAWIPYPSIATLIQEFLTKYLSCGVSMTVEDFEFDISKNFFA